MRNRFTCYPEEFWGEVGLLMPGIEPPTEKEVVEAYRTISSFPDIYNSIKELFEAFQTIKRNGSDKIAQRYGPEIGKLWAAARDLCRKMEEDILEAEKKDGEV